MRPENAARAPKDVSAATVAETARPRKLTDSRRSYNSPIDACGPRRSSRAEVPMVKPAEHGLRAHLADNLDFARHGSVPIQR